MTASDEQLAATAPQARPSPAAGQLGSAGLTLLVFLFALGLRVGYWVHLRSHIDQGISHYNLVQSAPFADARCWHDMGEDLADGLGVRVFPGRRPLYGQLLGCLYAVFGSHYDLAIAANALMSAATVALAWVLFARLGGPLVGGVVAAQLLFSSEAICCAATTLTETLGLALLVWHLWELCLGITQGSYRRLALSGLLLGLSNVARPLTLLAAPGDVVLVAWLLYRGGATRRVAGTAAIWFAVGVASAILPYMTWNLVRNGIFALSDNTAGDLYGVTAPQYGNWDMRIEQDLSQRGLHTVAERYNYLMAAAKQNLRRHPEVFLGRVREYALRAVVRLDQWLHYSSLALLGYGLWRATRQGRLTLSALMVGIFLALAAGWGIVVSGPLLAAAALAALCGRPHPLSCLLVNLVLFSLLAISLFGSFMDRLFLMFAWAACGLYLGGIAWAWDVALGAAPPQGRATTALFGREASAWSPWIRRAALVTAGVWGLGVVLLGWRNLWAGPKPFPTGVIEEIDVPAAIARVARQRPELFAPDEQRSLGPGGFAVPFSHEFNPGRQGVLIATLARVDSLPMFFSGDEQRSVDSHEVAFRQYPRTMLQMVSYAPNGNWSQISVVWPGDVRHLVGRDYLLLGRMNSAQKTNYVIEGVALVPWDSVTQEISPDDAVLATEDEAHRQILRRLVDPQTGPSEVGP